MFSTTTAPAVRRSLAVARRAAISLAAAVSIAAISPGAARAGTYFDYAGDPAGINLPAPSLGDWGFYDTSGQVQRASTFPTRTKGASVAWQINYPTGVLAQNTGVGMQLQVPASGAKSAISINRVWDWTQLDLRPLNLDGAPEAPALGLNSIPTQGTIGDSASFNGTTTQGTGHDSGILPANTKSRQIGVFCAFWGPAYYNCTLPSPFMTIRGLKAELSEGVAPTGSIDGGTLTAGGILKGIKTLSYTAGDQESGVERIEALLDGVVVATDSNARDLTQPVASQTGACTYSGLQACPSTQTNVMSVDTNQVPDGAYELSLRMADAAGNTHTVLAPDPVVVDNHPAPVNTELPAITGSATEGQVLGDYDGIWQNAIGSATYRWKRCNADLSGCVPVATTATYRLQAGDVGKRMELEVTRVNDVGEAVAATSPATDAVQAAGNPAPVIINPPPAPGPAGQNGANGQNGATGPNGQTLVLHLNGSNATASASLKALFSSSKRGTIRSAYGKKVLVTGQLLTPGGQAIAGAKVQVFQQDKQVGAALVPSGEVTTDASGKFAYTTTAVRSRTIRFAYRTHIEDATFASTTDISLEVVAKISLGVNRHALHNGQTVTFKGSVAGAPANARKVIELQVKKGSRWMTFKTARLSKGRFSARYRFIATHRTTTYVFRARVRQEAGFPFLTGVSKTAKVTVRG
jgi:hypothetical protein